MFSCQYCNKSVCLDILKKTNFIERLNLLVRTLNMNDDDNESKVCVISTNFTRKLTNLFFIIIGGKYSMNLPLKKKYYLIKMEKLTCI